MFPFVQQFGEASTQGPNSVNNLINIEAFGQFKFGQFQEFQEQDKQLSYHIERQITTYSEVAFVLELLAGDNNNTHTITIDRMASFFRDQKFPPGFTRRNGGAGLAILSATAGQTMGVHPIAPGANDANGNYVTDPPFTNFVSHKNLPPGSLQTDDTRSAVRWIHGSC